MLKRFESRFLGRTDPVRIKKIESLRKLHNEELHNIYTMPNIIIMIKSRAVR
jgi:hypothetical protein